MNAAIGDLVAYEDQANPRTVYRVARYITGYGVEYELVKVETGEVTFSDLRQSGWARVTPQTRTCPNCGEAWFGTPTVGDEGPDVGPDRSKCRTCMCVWLSDGTIALQGSCSTCDEIKTSGGFGPRHEASPNCQSGKHSHCTCDTCF